MTDDFKKQVAHALATVIGRIALDELRLPWDADVPQLPLASRLAPRVADALEEAMRHGEMIERENWSREDGLQAALAVLRGERV